LPHPLVCLSLLPTMNKYLWLLTILLSLNAHAECTSDETFRVRGCKVSHAELIESNEKLSLDLALKDCKKSAPLKVNFSVDLVHGTPDPRDQESYNHIWKESLEGMVATANKAKDTHQAVSFSGYRSKKDQCRLTPYMTARSVSIVK
jgi:hypothetical protein